MPVFIVTMDGRLSEHEEFKLLQNRNIIRISASSYLVRKCTSVVSAINAIAPNDDDKTHLKPWFVFQVTKPWLAQGAEQDYQSTHNKTIAFMRAYPEDTPDEIMKNPLASLDNLSDDELDNYSENQK